MVLRPEGAKLLAQGNALGIGNEQKIAQGVALGY